MRFLNTDGKNPDFVHLCHQLDSFLNEIAGGEEQRAQYIPYNQIEDILDVILLYDKETPVGCASFKRYSDDCAEVKRVYIRREYRSQGISKQLMVRLESEAKKQGYKSLVLESGEPLTAAMRLYRGIGFQVIPNYGPYAAMEESICMKKDL